MRRIVLLSFLLVVATAATAQTLSQSKVHDNAETFALQLKHTPQVSLQKAPAPEFGNLSLYNIEGGGWVIASGDSRVRPILAYCDTGSLNPTTLPDNMRAWLQGYEAEMAQLDNLPPEAFLPQKDNDKGNNNPKSSLPNYVAPLLTSTWQQSGYGYNDLVPYDDRLAMAGRTVTVGCVALAMAQVMRYWEFPQHGYGQHSYTREGSNPCWHYGTLTVDFAHTNYQYDYMRDQLNATSTNAERNAIATLCYHCGVACDMDYNCDCVGSSGSLLDNALRGLKKYFHYSPNAKNLYKVRYSDEEWNAMLKEDLAAGRPVIYSGYGDGGSNGHAFVLDGYDVDVFFHVNWGWGGSHDGYFTLTSLNPAASYYFTYGQEALIHLEPERNPIPIFTLASDLTLDSTTYSMDAPISGSYSFTNIGDAEGDFYVRTDVYNSMFPYYSNDTHDGIIGTIDDAHHIDIAPGETIHHTFSNTLSLPEGNNNKAILLVSDDTITGPIKSNTWYYEADHACRQNFNVVNNAQRKMGNLILLYRFHDGEDWLHLFRDVNVPMAYFVQYTLNPALFNQIGIKSTIGNHAKSQNEQFVNPFIDPNDMGYYAPYHATIYPSGDPDPYPECGPSEREMEFLSHAITYFDSLHLVDSNTVLDYDNDGYIDHVIFINSGHYSNTRRGGMTLNHTSHYPDTAAPLTINGKRIGTYSMVEGRYSNTSDAYPALVPSRPLANAIANALGLPDLSHRDHHTSVSPVPDSSILASGLQGIPAIFKQRYLGIGDDPIRITADGTYTINCSDRSLHNNLYYIPSTIDSNQWFLIEYRNFDAYDYYDTVCSNNGLYFSRWLNNTPIDPCYGGNAHADYYNTPNAYWTFRPGSNSDTINGNLAEAHFSAAAGRDYFSPNTDPHPYLADGTPERSFRIYNITAAGDSCTFSVHFFAPGEENEGIPNNGSSLRCSLYPNPATGSTTLSISGISGGVTIDVVDMNGRTLQSSRLESSGNCAQHLDLRQFPRGAYFVRVTNSQASTVKKLIIK